MVTLLSKSVDWPVEQRIPWAAGLFEGEGHIGSRLNKKQEFNVTIFMQIAMTDLDTLQKFHYIVGGNLRGPYSDKRSAGHKEMWSWMIMSAQNVIQIYDSFRPFLSDRRIQQGDLALLKRYVYEQVFKESSLVLKHQFPDYILKLAMSDGKAVGV